MTRLSSGSVSLWLLPFPCHEHLIFPAPSSFHQSYSLSSARSMLSPSNAFFWRCSYRITMSFACCYLSFVTLCSECVLDYFFLVSLSAALLLSPLASFSEYVSTLVEPYFSVQSHFISRSEQRVVCLTAGPFLFPLCFSLLSSVASLEGRLTVRVFFPHCLITMFFWNSRRSSSFLFSVPQFLKIPTPLNQENIYHAHFFPSSSVFSLHAL